MTTKKQAHSADKKKPSTPKFVQIATSQSDDYTVPTLFALDESGQVWNYFHGTDYREKGWFPLATLRHKP